MNTTRGVLLAHTLSAHTYIPIRNARVLDAASINACGLALRRFLAARETLGAARTSDAEGPFPPALRESGATGQETHSPRADSRPHLIRRIVRKPCDSTACPECCVDCCGGEAVEPSPVASRRAPLWGHEVMH